MSHFEDVFFYLDLAKDILKKKEIIKAIQYFISEKNKSNIQGHYGLLIFQQQGNPIFITGKKDSNIIINAIEENWKTRPKKESFFENGLFYIFSYIAETVRKKSKFNRIIIITDTPSDLSEDYTEALFGLVSKIKTFPTFIDIVRISQGEERFFTDDVKLNILANDTKGGIFYISEKKEFFPLLKNLVKSKQLVTIFEDQPDKIKINKEDYFFYSHLAKKLKPIASDEVGLKCFLCKEEICPVCMEVGDKLVICEECKTHFHNCCITNYTIQHNIGIPHIFRCPKCDILLQIEQDEIVQPFNVEEESVFDYLEEQYTPKSTLFGDEEKTDIKQHFVEETSLDVEKQTRETKNQPNLQKNQTIRIGGFFGKVYTVKKEGNRLIYEKTDKPFNNNNYLNNNNDFLNENQQNAQKSQSAKQIWKPSMRESEQIEGKEKYRFTICPECGGQVKSQVQGAIRCPNCGFKISN
jgi:DNA-directed RNA polymerase subunit RPC12/RpoP